MEASASLILLHAESDLTRLGKKKLLPHSLLCCAALVSPGEDNTLLSTQELGSTGSWPGSRLAVRFVSVIQSTERAADELNEGLSK